jgi:magnesium-transporting ATPase (P-type)
LSFGAAILLASTVYHAGVVLAQVGNALACRSDRTRSTYLGWLSNRYLLGGILIELLTILSIIYIPSLAKIFSHVPVPGWIWIILGFYALVLYSIEWIRKLINRGLRKYRADKLPPLSLQEASQ